jgi:quinol monooxygenase YgiN
MHHAAHCTERRGVSHTESGRRRLTLARPRSSSRTRFCQVLLGGKMTSITTENRVATLINVFTVAPNDQQRLVDLLTTATERTIKHLPGFVSASIHKSTDGTRVVNYAQWHSPGDLDAMLKNPAAQEHIKPIMQIAQADPHLYEVVDTIATLER